MATVQDPTTGVSFPAEQTLWYGKQLVALGAGARIRSVALLKVKVYAAALYVDAEAAAAPLKAAASGKDDALATALVDGDFDKAMQLQFVRDVEGPKLAKGFDETLRPKLSTDLDQLKQFCDFFESKVITSGCTVLLAWRAGGGALQVLYSEAPVADAAAASPQLELDSKALCSALYDLHLGKASIAPGLRTAALAGARRL